VILYGFSKGTSLLSLSSRAVAVLTDTPWPWPTPARGGKCKGWVPSPKGARRAVCTSEVRKMRVPLARDRGSHPERTEHLVYRSDRGHGLHLVGDQVVSSLWLYAR
jgi:hypothetical protein